MVDAIRVAEKALGSVQIGPSPREQAIQTLRRSLFVVESMKQGEIFTSENLRSIRPANGLHTRHLQQIMGKRCTRDVESGTPLAWDMVQQP
jgi:sialic acid synthase SpsE